jgi:DNA polymerase III alpha subunit
MELSKFQRFPPELRDQPPKRVTTKDVGKTIGIPEGELNNLEKLVESIPEGCNIEEAKRLAPQILGSYESPQ